MIKKFFLIILLLSLNVYAEEMSSQPALLEKKLSLEEGLAQHMALDLRNMDIVDTLKFLAQKGNINIIASKSVEGRVSLFLKDVSIGDALEIILLANSLAYEMRGEILYVMTNEEYKQAHGVDFKGTYKAEIYKLKYAKPEAVFNALEVVRSEKGKLIVDEDSGTVVFVDTKEKISVMREVLESIDQELITKTFPLQYLKADEAVKILAKRLDVKKTGSITADDRSNQVIISALPKRMQEIAEIIRSIDVKTKEVLIEAKILKVSLSDDFDMGIDWRVAIKSFSFGVDLGLPTTGTEAISKYGTMVTGLVENGRTGAAVKALQQFGEVRNLSSPSIAVVNGEEAKIHIGSTEAYVDTTVATGGTTATTAAQVKFLDVGVKLFVTPTINDHGYVTMKIKPEISSKSGTHTYSIDADVSNTIPLIDKTTAETTVMVKDGVTVIIGGLRKDEKLNVVKKIPFLGDLPWLGALFRNTNQDTEKTEIVVFLTPHIITGDKDVVDTAFLPKKNLRGYQ